MVAKTNVALLSALLSAFLGVVLASCAAVDQFGTRIYDGNLNSQNAMNQEILLNVVRASRLQPLNFVAVSQVSGGQTETLNTGLPTITIGPLQTVAQHQFQISNSLSSSATGSYTSNPLVSTEFQTGILSPIDPRVVAYLVAAHPREPVFYSVTDNISFELNNGSIFRLVNDPTRDTPSFQCPEKVNAASDALALSPSLMQHCNYALFLRYFKVLILAGMTSELAVSAKSPTGSPMDSPPSAPAGSGSPSPSSAQSSPGSAKSKSKSAKSG